MPTGCEDSYICHQCIGDEYLKNEIKSEGARAECSYCGKKNLKALSLEWLTDKIHWAIEQHFQPGYVNIPYGWEPDGLPINELIQEMAEVEEGIADDVLESLDLQYGSSPRDCYDYDPYGDESYYVPSAPDDWEYRESWQFFCEEVTKRARFFSSTAEGILDEIFGDLVSFKRRNGDPVIRQIGPGTDYEVIFRARIAPTKSELEQIIKAPVEQLAAPPSTLAKNGRMNAAGISVFYGADSVKTCIAEVRPPVGCRVVVGKFQVIRELQLLDLDVLSKVYASGSIFEPGFGQREGQAAFFKELARNLTMPVLPGNEVFDYLPTQVVAEYLAEKIDPPLDGIVFHSTQDGGNGENIVLFQGKSKVEPYVLPKGTKISVSHGRWESHKDYDGSIYVEEILPVEVKDGSVAGLEKEHWASPGDEFNKDDSEEATLRLDVHKGVEVRLISSASYNCDTKDFFSRIRR